MDACAGAPAKFTEVFLGLAALMGQNKMREEELVKKNTTRIHQLQREIVLVLTICRDRRKMFHMREFFYKIFLLYERIVYFYFYMRELYIFIGKRREPHLIYTYNTFHV